MKHTLKLLSLFSLGSVLLLVAACGPRPRSSPTPFLTSESPTASLSPTSAPTQTPYVITATGEADPAPLPGPSGTLILSLDDSGYSHLFAYAPQTTPLTRLTADAWDDIAPALSPDGTRVAYASHRNGYWDLYLLYLQSGRISRLTDSPEYDGSPSWSPDDAWLAYESYVDDNLEIFIHSASDPAQAAIRLTLDPAADYSPAWSPRLPGRQIAFISNRSGEPEVWIADLDRVGDDRFVDVSQNPATVEAHPAWSPDGELLAWSSTDPATGLTGIYVWDERTPDAPARWEGSGDWPVWQDNTHIVTRLSAPNQTFLTGFTAPLGEISLPPILLPGSLDGLSYGNTTQPLPGPFKTAAAFTPPPLYVPALEPQPDVPSGRASLVPLKDVQAPYPQLHDLVNESFQALRARVAAETGWDVLASLDNAYIPLTQTLDPGLGADWLYTGRAFTLNSALPAAGWMAVVREDFGQQTYWRVFIRTRAQDGSEGAPLRQIPWDFAARAGDSNAYDQGGRLLASLPSGYWLDLTALALQFGWERLPALTNWRTYINAAHYNEFAMTQGLDWRAAILELYPPDVLVTPTAIIPPTRTPTRTPWWYQTPTPTHTATPRPTSTP